jgi:glycosyltransferase involved in cell wall biosynthesis
LTRIAGQRPGAAAGDERVSCLMVTLASADRLARAKVAIAAYCAQTYSNRELIIVVDPAHASAKAGLSAHVSGLARGDIRIIEPVTAAPLGALRNLAGDAARGAILCQWDDDDLHHPERIRRQADALRASGAEAVCLQQVIQFFPAARTLYCANWRATDATVFPGSLMCKADAAVRYPETGPAARLGEDLDVALRLGARGGLHALADTPHLYVYVSHGANSWNAAHHRMLADRLAVSAGLLRRREAALREDLRAFDFGPGPVTVRGPAGPAFVL